MKDICRICARELCGNQRRWIFHSASKLNLQVLLSHVLEKEVLRDGRAEFACSKCAFMLDRIYRFDTVIARIEALSIERLQKLVSEKDRLKLCVASLYRKNNTDMCLEDKDGDGTVGNCSLSDARYAALLQDDFAYSGFESWTEHDDHVQEHSTCKPTEGNGNRSKRCHCCAVLRVPDADYEAICKVPRKLAQSISTVPSTRCSASILNEEVPKPILTNVELDKVIVERENMERVSSGSSVESLHGAIEGSPLFHREEEQVKGTSEDPKWHFCTHNNPMKSCVLQINKLDAALSLVKAFDYKPIQSPKGSRIPVKLSPPGARSTTLTAYGSSLPHPLIAGLGFMNLIAQPVPRITQDFIPEIADLQELWEDVYEDYIPLRVKNLFEKQYCYLNPNEVSHEQCDSELHNEEFQMQTLQDRLQQLGAKNKILQENLHEMNSQLLVTIDVSQQHKCTIQNLNETLTSKISEAEEMNEIIQEQNKSIDKLQEMLNQSQLDNFQMPGMLSSTKPQVDFFNLQSTLFCTQLELQRVQRMLRQSERQLTDARHVQQLLESDLKEAQKQKESMWTHNQELHVALLQLQVQLQNASQQLEKVKEQKNAVIQEQELTIKHRNQALLQKEQLLQRAIDEKYCALEEREHKLRQAQLAMREKEQELERLRSVLSSNEETINELMERGSDHSKMMVIVKNNDRTNGEANKDLQNMLEQELANAKEEFQLLSRKEGETRAELCSLQFLVAKQNEDLQAQAADVESLTQNIQIKEEFIKDLQVQLVNPEEVPAIESLTHEVLKLREKVAVMELHGQEGFGNRSQELVLMLERLVTERARLNDHLQSEWQIYSKLVTLHSPPKSCEESKTLQLELEAVRMLRGRLEEALVQSLQQLNDLEAENRAPIDFGGGDWASFRAPHKHAF